MKRGGVLGLLGLGARAGSLVSGTVGVRAALKRDDLALVIIACDRSERTNEKVCRLARAKGLPVMEGPPARELGQSVGRDVVQVIGVRDGKLAAGLRAYGQQQE